MTSKYRWKRNVPPTPDQAAQSEHLLDESQFSDPRDQHMAEETARKNLGVPVRIPDDEKPVLPQAAPVEDDLEP
jgi:hypothetical protein